jgi:hypothetical protein
MAQQQSWAPPHLNQNVVQVFKNAVEQEDSIASVNVSTLDPQSRLAGPELKVELQVRVGLSKDELEAVLHRVTENWAASEIIASSVDSMALVVKPASN